MLSQAIEQLSSSEDEDPSDSTAGIDVLRMIIVNNKFIYMYLWYKLHTFTQMVETVSALLVL